MGGGQGCLCSLGVGDLALVADLQNLVLDQELDGFFNFLGCEGIGEVGLKKRVRKEILSFVRTFGREGRS